MRSRGSASTPYLLQVVGVDLGRQPVRLARPRQHGGAHPVVVSFQLAGQRIEILLPSLEAALLQQVPHAIDIAGRVVEILLDFNDPGPEERAVVHALFDARTRERRERLVAALRTRVALQAHQRGGVTLLVDAGVQHVLEAVEDLLAHVEVRNHQPATQCGRRGPALRGRDEDVEILLYAVVPGAGAGRLELGNGGGEVRFPPFIELRLEIEDLPVVFARAPDLPRTQAGSGRSLPAGSECTGCSP